MFGKNVCICLTIQIASNALLPTVFVCLLEKHLWTFNLCNIPQGSDIYKSNESLHLPLMTWKRLAGLSGDQQILLLPSDHMAANIHSFSRSEFALKHISAVGCVRGCFKILLLFGLKPLHLGHWLTKILVRGQNTYFFGNFRTFSSPVVHLGFLFSSYSPCCFFLFCFQSGDEFIHCNSILMQWHKSLASRKQK